MNLAIVGNSSVGIDWKSNGGTYSPVHNANVVLGLGGKIPLLVKPTCPLPLLRRFTGGGTVVVDPMNTLYTTFIGRPGLVKEEGPRGVMDWSARAIYNDVFRSMNGSRATWSSGGDFKLLENDYVLSLPNKPNLLKFGGNAQALTSSGFLHHTSFLYDWDDANMSYLTVPEKRPDYRGDRGHGGFLVKMKEVWGEVSEDGRLE